MNTELLLDHINELILKFEKDKTHYLSKGYPESQVRVDFLNPLFAALGWDKQEGKRKPIMVHLRALFNRVNDDLNGNIFKPHACDEADVDSAALAEIIENLYAPKSPYRFDAIGVELLGSIYERYLGSTIKVTAQRASHS